MVLKQERTKSVRDMMITIDAKDFAPQWIAVTDLKTHCCHGDTDRLELRLQSAELASTMPAQLIRAWF